MSIVLQASRAAVAAAVAYLLGGSAGCVGAAAALCTVALFEILADARAVAARPKVVTKLRGGGDKGGAYAMVPQSSLGIVNGLLIKLVYQYRILGTSNCMTRLLQRSALALFNRKRAPCSAEAIAAFARKAGISPDGWDRRIDEYTSIDDFFTRAYAKLDWGAPRARHIVSPSEGTAVAFASVGLMRQLWVKQKALTMQNTARVASS